MKDAGMKILEGDIGIEPYKLGDRTGCDFCPYHAICGFEDKMPGFEYKTMEKLEKNDAIIKMRREVDIWE